MKNVTTKTPSPATDAAQSIAELATESITGSASETQGKDAERLGEFFPFFLQLPPHRIVELKALLESYDELGVLRTLNRKTGVVVILAITDLRQTLEELIDSLSGELEMVRIPRPEGVSEDWLVEAMADE